MGAKADVRPGGSVEGSDPLHDELRVFLSIIRAFKCQHRGAVFMQHADGAGRWLYKYTNASSSARASAQQGSRDGIRLPSNSKRKDASANCGDARDAAAVGEIWQRELQALNQARPLLCKAAEGFTGLLSRGFFVHLSMVMLACIAKLLDLTSASHGALLAKQQAQTKRNEAFTKHKAKRLKTDLGERISREALQATLSRKHSEENPPPKPTRAAKVDTTGGRSKAMHVDDVKEDESNVAKKKKKKRLLEEPVERSLLAPVVAKKTAFKTALIGQQSLSTVEAKSSKKVKIQDVEHAREEKAPKPKKTKKMKKNKEGKRNVKNAIDDIFGGM
mmetsp:Transcript_13817/g.24704  ORF Transcript_13817/g.24704 Transcript_13817/m.24704 type:complete len:332 (+) Transcript_13817:1512-2507(+)